MRSGAFWLLLAPVTALARMEAFPGLDAAIQKADAIVVVCVESNLDLSAWGRAIGAEPYTRHQCRVLASVKGSLTPGFGAAIALRPPATMPPGAPPALGHHYLVFLESHGATKTWRSLDFPACVLPVSPLSDWSQLPAGTPKERIKTIIRDFLRWQDQFTEMQRKSLELLLKE